MEKNPIETILNRREAERLEKREREFPYKYVLLQDLRTALEGLPELLSSRDFINCNLSTWHDKQYATFELHYENNDGATEGLNLVLLLDEHCAPMYLLDSKRGHFDNTYSGGILYEEKLISDRLFDDEHGISTQWDMERSIAVIELVRAGEQTRRVSNRYSIVDFTMTQELERLRKERNQRAQELSSQI